MKHTKTTNLLDRLPHDIQSIIFALFFEDTLRVAIRARPLSFLTTTKDRIYLSNARHSTLTAGTALLEGANPKQPSQ
jgi:hypothetical protein